jgi:hypothetical protein
MAIKKCPDKSIEALIGSNFHHLKVLFASATLGTNPIWRDIRPFGTRGDVLFGAALRLVINPATN